jgi:DnaJ-class molecular chaperone
MAKWTGNLTFPCLQTEQILTEYRIKAVECHPDKNQGNPNTLEKFQVGTIGQLLTTALLQSPDESQNFGKISEKFRKNFGKISEKFRKNFGKISEKFRKNFGTISEKFRKKSGL